jgi:triacylglycerol lipase
MREFSKYAASVISLFYGLTIMACSSTHVKPGYDYCATQYPVILVHGLSLRDRALLVRYWGNVPDVLKQNGAVVHAGGQDAYGIISHNAAVLKKNILEVLEATKSRKVNIIAHSRGGLDSRYMISILGMEDKVASLTTIATPHRGSSMADLIMKRVPEGSIVPDIINFFAKIFGDENPESYNAGLELTRESMKKFNRKVADAPEVYYQSYAAIIDDSFPNLIWRSMYSKIKKYEGANDGLVSVDSAKWGNYRGLMTCEGRFRASHVDVVGMHFLTGVYCFKAADFYRELVHELKLKGY